MEQGSGFTNRRALAKYRRTGTKSAQKIREFGWNLPAISGTRNQLIFGHFILLKRHDEKRKKGSEK